jgi:hypothetical protein
MCCDLSQSVMCSGSGSVVVEVCCSRHHYGHLADSFWFP